MDDETLFRILADLEVKQISLNLSTIDICYLIMLHYFVTSEERGSLDEQTLTRVYRTACEVLNLDGTQQSARAIQRLRDNNLLARINGGLVGANIYVLTGLAVSIIDFYTNNDLLTEETLSTRTKSIITKLDAIKHKAEFATSVKELKRDVELPLNEVVSESLIALEKRQRMLDYQQEKVQDKIISLLDKNWEAAVSECELLLEQTGNRLREINSVLAKDCQTIESLLHDLEAMPAIRESEEISECLYNIFVQVNSIKRWGAGRIEIWQKYFSDIHRYLRNVVSLDPNRELSTRMIHSLKNWGEHKYYFTVVTPTRTRALRETKIRRIIPPLTIEVIDWDTPIEEYVPDEYLELCNILINDAIVSGYTKLTSLVDDILEQLPEERRVSFLVLIISRITEGLDIEVQHTKKWIRLKSIPYEIQELNLKGPI